MDPEKKPTDINQLSALNITVPGLLLRRHYESYTNYQNAAKANNYDDDIKVSYSLTFTNAGGQGIILFCPVGAIYRAFKGMVQLSKIEDDEKFQKAKYDFDQITFEKFYKRFL